MLEVIYNTLVFGKINVVRILSTSILDQPMLCFVNFFNILFVLTMNQAEPIYKKYINFKLKYLKILFLLQYHNTYNLMILMIP